MRVILAIQLFFSIYKTFGQGTFPENDALEKSALFPSTTSSKQFSVLREILNQESLVRFSMVQKIQTLVMDAIESRNLSKTLEGRLSDVSKELEALKINDERLKEEIVKLKKEMNAEYMSGNKIIDDSNFQSYNDSEILFLKGKTSALQKKIKVLSLENADIKEQLVVLKNKELESLRNETFTLYQKYDERVVYERKTSYLSNRLFLIENDIQNLSVSFNEAIENIRQNTADVQELKESKNLTDCEKGWVSYRDSCYFFSSIKMNFHDAATYCTNALSGASLLEDQSPEEEIWIFIQFRSRGLQTTWLGITDIFEEKKFVRMSDAKELTHFNWSKGQPDNYENNEHCVEILPDGKWNDLNCSRRIGFICKLHRN
ncbi:asialoglycoprotein receptor 1-like [Saccostrea echinata]|uniref:asialoglycoprotein receptor 1-like n=1 Tax=Saccostrea echinata TaxID=191078 RepID=UPI002A8171BC|nr:asialoglycoprotein receptor 1-like [Saccostrea echinata]